MKCTSMHWSALETYSSSLLEFETEEKVYLVERKGQKSAPEEKRAIQILKDKNGQKFDEISFIELDNLNEVLLLITIERKQFPPDRMLAEQQIADKQKFKHANT